MTRRNHFDGEAAAAWRDTVMRRSEGLCWLCLSRAEEAHHVIKQQHLRRRAKELGVDPGWLQWDVRVGVPLCGVHHGQLHGLNPKPFPTHLIPDSVFEFAADFGMTYYLERHLGVAA